MIYRNPTSNAIRFKVAGLAYSVPPGGECDIPVTMAYVVASRGLPLVQGSAGGERVEAERAPAPPKQPLPPGVAIGPMDDADDDGASDDEASPVIEKAVADLNAEGVRLPKRRKK